MKKRERDIEKVVEALADEPVDDEAARAELARLRIDVKGLAGSIREKIAAADAADAAGRKAKFADAERAYAAEVERLERSRIAQKTATREENLVAFQALLKRAPKEALVGMHFHKYESATDEELVELLAALRHLLGVDEDE